jgi:WD40 repeat protein
MHGDKLISGSGDNTIKVWSTDTWTCERTLEGHDGEVSSLLVHGDKLISSSSDDTIKVWSTDTWACERTIEGHGSTVVRAWRQADQRLRRRHDQSVEHRHLDMRARPRRPHWCCVPLVNNSSTRELDRQTDLF